MHKAEMDKVIHAVLDKSNSNTTPTLVTRLSTNELFALEYEDKVNKLIADAKRSLDI